MTDISDVDSDLKSSPLYLAFERKRFGPRTCFLCGCRLTKQSRADEHVMPKWIQQRFSLWNQELVLLNGSRIPYRSLVIPCCGTCNNQNLATIEATVCAAVESGPDAVRSLPDVTLFVWLGKILYGLLYKEYFLRHDLRRRSRRTIVPRQLLRHFKLHHFFLQAARTQINFHGFPASIFVHDLQCAVDPRRQFNFRDSPALLGIAIQLGSTGIIGVLQDAGAQRQVVGHLHDEYKGKALHPIQFAEMVARTFYKASLLNRVPKYMIAEHDGAFDVIQTPLMGFSMKPVFDDWDQETYAKVLAALTMQPFDMIYQPPNLVRSYLSNEDGGFCRIDVEEVEWP